MDLASRYVGYSMGGDLVCTYYIDSEEDAIIIFLDGLFCSLRLYKIYDADSVKNTRSDEPRTNKGVSITSWL